MPNNTIPIDNEHFESVIVYNALTNDTYLSSIIDVTEPSYFKNNNIREIFEIIQNYFIKYQTTPSVNELKNYLVSDKQKSAFKEVVLSFKHLDTQYNPEALYENTELFLKEKAIYQAVLNTANKYSKDVTKMDASETLDIFEKACNISLVDNLGSDYFKDIDEHIQNVLKVENRLPTGYRWLDKKLNGGLLQDGRALYVFTGVTNSGKSIVLGNIASNLIKQNKKVAIISLEMPEDMYTQRIDGQLLRMPVNNLKNDIDNLKKNINNYRRQYNDAALFIKEFPPKSVTVNHIKAYLKKLVLKKGIEKLDAIIIDYVNLIQPTIVTGQSYVDVKLVAEQLRAMSYGFKCPIITVSQLGRTAFEELNPGMETISESIGLSMTADFQASIWSNDQDKELGVIHMGIQKNRFGEAFGTHAFKIDYRTLAIDEIDEDFTENDEIEDMENKLERMMQ